MKIEIIDKDENVIQTIEIDDDQKMCVGHGDTEFSMYVLNDMINIRSHPITMSHIIIETGGQDYIRIGTKDKF